MCVGLPAAPARACLGAQGCPEPTFGPPLAGLITEVIQADWPPNRRNSKRDGRCAGHRKPLPGMSRICLCGMSMETSRWLAGWRTGSLAEPSLGRAQPCSTTVCGRTRATAAAPSPTHGALCPRDEGTGSGGRWKSDCARAVAVAPPAPASKDQRPTCTKTADTLAPKHQRCSNAIPGDLACVGIVVGRRRGMLPLLRMDLPTKVGVEEVRREGLAWSHRFHGVYRGDCGSRQDSPLRDCGRSSLPLSATRRWSGGAWLTIGFP